ncbi:hypothetical protein ACFPRL_12830 [Pseudoclavibacter helvolus]
MAAANANSARRTSAGRSPGRQTTAPMTAMRATAQRVRRERRIHARRGARKRKGRPGRSPCSLFPAGLAARAWSCATATGPLTTRSAAAGLARDARPVRAGSRSS